jgi:hypothetical protein
MAEVFFESAKTHKRYTVVKWDKEANKVTLKGESGLEFEEKFKPDLFKQMGYTLKQA